MVDKAFAYPSLLDFCQNLLASRRYHQTYYVSTQLSPTNSNQNENKFITICCEQVLLRVVPISGLIKS